MGSFTPWGAACCVAGRCWGIFTSVLMIASPASVKCALLGLNLYVCLLDDRYQFGRLGRGTPSQFRFFPHVRNLDALQHGLDALVHLTERFADVAAVALTALPANGDARSNEQRAVDSLNHLEGRNRVRRARQSIATVRTVLRMQ